MLSTYALLEDMVTLSHVVDGLPLRSREPKAAESVVLRILQWRVLQSMKYLVSGRHV